VFTLYFKFRKEGNTLIQIEVEDQFVAKPKNIENAFANYSKSVLTSCPTAMPSYFVTSHLYPGSSIRAAWLHG
jgi:hypothetical protein